MLETTPAGLSASNLVPVESNRPPGHSMKAANHNPAMSRILTNWYLKNVPPDIWRLIFFGLVDSVPSSTRTRVAMCLTHVCSLWRVIASEAPELWAEVDVAVNFSLRMHTPRNVHFLSLVFHNARAMPLKLKLSFRHSFIPPPKPLNIRPAVVMLQNIFRARYLEISLYIINQVRQQGYPAYIDIAAEMQGVPRLEELVLDLGGKDSDLMSLLWLAPLWSSAHSLHILFVKATKQFHWRIQTTDVLCLQGAHFPFHRLTTLKISLSISLDAFLTLLSYTTSLVQASFYGIKGTVPTNTARLASIHLPALQNLELRSLGSGIDDEICPSMTKLLANFSTPSLTVLSLLSDHKWSLEGFRTFLSNSSCQIKHLCIDIEDSDEETKLECLRLLPSLEFLEVSMYRHYMRTDIAYLDGIFMSAMRDWDALNGRFHTCPNLTQLTIDYFMLYDKSKTIFADMVEERWRRSRRAADFKVVVNKVETRQDTQESLRELVRLFALKKAGLDITISPAHWLEDLICH